MLSVTEVSAQFVDTEDDVMWNFLELYELLSVSVTSSPSVGCLLLLTELLKRGERERNGILSIILQLFYWMDGWTDGRTINTMDDRSYNVWMIDTIVG